MRITLIDPVDDGGMAMIKIAMRNHEDIHTEATFAVMPEHLESLYELIVAIMRLSDRVEGENLSFGSQVVNVVPD